MPRGSSSVGTAALLAALVAGGCASRAPTVPVGLRDGAAGPDGGGIAVDAPPVDAPYVRPDALALPGADLEVILPYLGPEATVTLEAAAQLGQLDVFFSVDTTGSFGGEIAALQSTLTSEILPALEARVADVAIGVGAFEDFPRVPFGDVDDRPFRLLSAMTTDRARAASAVASLSLGNGADTPESGAEALYQIATGAGFTLDGASVVAPYRGSGEGGVGFRRGSLRTVVHVTDAPTHEPADYAGVVPGAHGSTDAVAACRTLGVRVLGVASSSGARDHLERWATGTGAITAPTGGSCPTGPSGAPRPPSGGVCPLVFDIAGDGSGLGTAIVDALTDLLDSVAWSEAHGEAVDDPLAFVRAIEAASATAPDGGTPPGREDRIDVGDGVLDTFTDVRGGSSLVFVAHLQNRTVEAADYDQVFRVTIRILGDDLVIAERVVRVIVPRRHLDAGTGALDAGEMDAGGADAGVLDAGDDAGALDAGELDAGALDAGADA